MEHLVESHLGGYYTSSYDPKIIEHYCEDCGDHDRIILSWEDNKMEALEDYFKDIKMNEKYIRNELESGFTMDEIMEHLKYYYYRDRETVNTLYEEEIVDEVERCSLLKRVNLSRRDQLDVINSILSSIKEKQLVNKME